MKRKFTAVLMILLFGCSVFAQQSDIRMRSEYGSKDIDLMSVLYFEDIGISKMIFAGSDLKGKNYQISIKQYIKGKLAKDEVVFDSKEDDYFKIKDDKFTFRILTKVTAEQTAKFHFQFNGFSKQREYKIGKGEKEFAAKTFLDGAPDAAIPAGKSTYILTYMMPYLKADGSKQYCEVAQSGINPEEFGLEYAIPTYFLISIKFE